MKTFIRLIVVGTFVALGLSVASISFGSNAQEFAQASAAPVASDVSPSMYLASSSRVVVFSPRNLRWYAYQDGVLVASGKASGGASWCPDLHRPCHTPVGTFYVLRKGGANCRSSKYPLGKGGARMDYCMFFTNFYAIHGSNEVMNYNASHGCIRVLPAAAKWLSENFVNVGTRVVVQPY